MDQEITKNSSKSAELSPWLGHIHYKDEDGRDVIARGAVWCENRAEFDAALEAHLSKDGASFLWSEEVHNSIDWFRKHGSNGLMAGLAHKVDGMVRVALSDPKAAHDEALEDQSYLIIEEIEGVEPLDMQMGVYPKLTVPASLQEAMFGQPEPTEAEVEAAGGNAENVPPMKTYAILDAAKMPYLLTGELEFSGLEYQSLFQGAAQEEMGEHAPYIVRLEDGNDFTRKLFTGLKPPLGLWEKELGIFIRSHATLPELRKHFRKFTRVQDEQGKWYYFRFWEGRTCAEYFQSIKSNNDKVNRFFIAGKSSIISSLLSTQIHKTRQISFHGTEMLEPKSLVKFNNADIQIFDQISQSSFIEKLAADFLTSAPKHMQFLGIKTEKPIIEMVNSLCAELHPYGFESRNEIAKISALTLFKGTYFLSDPRLINLAVHHLKDIQRQPLVRAEYFKRALEDHYISKIIMNTHAIKQLIEWLQNVGRLSWDSSNFIHDEDHDLFVQGCRVQQNKFNISNTRIKELHFALSTVFTPNFLKDPLHDEVSTVFHKSSADTIYNNVRNLLEEKLGRE